MKMDIGILAGSIFNKCPMQVHVPDHINDIYYQYDLDGNLVMTHRNPIPGQDGGSQEEESPVTVPGDDFWDDDWENGGTSGVTYGEIYEGAPGDDFWDDDWENGGTSGVTYGEIYEGASGDDFWDDDWENGGTGGVAYGEIGGGAPGDDFWDDDWENGGTSGVIYGEISLDGGTGNSRPDTQVIARYTWDERDRLISSVMNDCDAWYIYGEDGQRTNKWTQSEETLYFNRMWTWHDGNTNDDQTAKHIYLGSERIVSQMNSWKGQQTYSEESHKTYYYHSDHLGSAQLITDYRGEEYQRTEYTPYGEEWVDKFQSENYVDIPYRFTGKERDEETGLYYYGARYLDPKTSVWISTDPALGDYIPEAGKDNSQLPGMGGVFNLINGNLYCYGGNNPVRYVDPDGRIILPFISYFTMNTGTWADMNLTGTTGENNKIRNVGCAVTGSANFTVIVNAHHSSYKVLDPGQINEKYCIDGIMYWSKLAEDYGFSAEKYAGSLSVESITSMANDIQNEYVILLNVNYKNNISPHWVGYDGLDANQFGNPSFRIGQSSDNDASVTKNTPLNKRQQRGWTVRWDINILVPQSQIKGYVIFKRSIEEE